jgi:hypothetical protein
LCLVWGCVVAFIGGRFVLRWRSGSCELSRICSRAFIGGLCLIAGCLIAGCHRGLVVCRLAAGWLVAGRLTAARAGWRRAHERRYGISG